MTIPDYSFEIFSREGERIAFIKNASDRKFSEELNGIGEASFSLLMEDEAASPDILKAGVNELRIYRTNEDQSNQFKLIWSGQIRKVKIAYKGDKITVTCQSLASYLKDRVVRNIQFTGQDKGAACFLMIQDAQTSGSFSSFGITEGVIQSSSDTFTLIENESIFDSINKFATTDLGFDWEITPNRIFNVYFPKKGKQFPGIAIQRGVNIEDANLEINAEDMINILYAIDGNKNVSTFSDPSYFPNYLRREFIKEYNDVTDFATLQQIALEELRLRKNVMKIFDVKLTDNPGLNPFVFGLGDDIKIKISDKPWFNIDNFFRVYSREFTIDNQGNENLSMKLAQV